MASRRCPGSLPRNSTCPPQERTAKGRGTAPRGAAYARQPATPHPAPSSGPEPKPGKRAAAAERSNGPGGGDLHPLGGGPHTASTQRIRDRSFGGGSHGRDEWGASNIGGTARTAGTGAGEDSTPEWARRSHNWQITHWAEDAAEEAEALLHMLITMEGDAREGGEPREPPQPARRSCPGGHRAGRRIPAQRGGRSTGPEDSPS